jgi:hypothetical protein
MKLDYKTRDAFALLVDNSIINEYDGNLFRAWGGKKGCDLHYIPADPEHIRELLMELWGEDLTPEAIEDAFTRLMGDGEYCEWPHAYCREDEDERPLSSFRSEEDEAFDWFEDVRAGKAAAEI